MKPHRGAVAYCVRADARRSWPSWLVLGVLVGLATGAVMGSAAGARRTASAYQDLVEETAAIDAALVPACGPDAAACPSAIDFAEEVRGRPGVAAAGAMASVLTPIADDQGVWATQGDACNTGTGEVSAIVPLDDHIGRDVFRLRILEGRAVDPERTDEAVIAPEAAALHGVEVGDTLSLYLGPDVYCDEPETWGEPTDVTVVGIGLSATEVPPKSGFYIQGIHLSPALASLDSTATNGFVGARLEPGVTIDDLTGDVGQGRFIVLFDRAGDLRGDEVDAGLQSDANALWLVAGLGALAACFVLGPTLARYRSTAQTVDETLSALGWSRGDRVLRSVAHAAVISGIAAVVAAGVLLASSSRTPIGDARSIEPRPGIELDGLVLVLGWIATTTLVGAGLGLLAARQRSRSTRPRRTPLARAAARLGLPAPTVLGVRVGLEPGPGQAPIRSSVLAVALGTAAIAGVLVYTGGAQHLRATPAWRGVPWDDIVFINEQTAGVPLAERAATWPEVEASDHALFFNEPLALGPDHTPATPMVFGSAEGAAAPTVLDGRVPMAPDEILLNPLLAGELGVEIGDVVEGTFDLTESHGPEAGSTDPFPWEVVGTGLVPIGDGRFERGVAITRAGYDAQLAGLPAEERTPDERADFLLIDRADGVTDAQMAGRLAAEGIPYDPDPAAEADFLDNIVNTDPTSTEAAPDLLAGLMALMGGAVLAYGILVSLSRNRHDLAVARAMGMTPRLLRRTARWAALAFTGASLVIALPVGIAVGRVVWRRYAEGLGVVPDPIVQPVEILALAAGALVLALVVATLGARWQSRTSPGAVLRSE